MSLRTYFIGLFRSYTTDGEVAAAEQAGREHARVIGGAYLRGFAEEFDAMLHGSRQQLLGVDDTVQDAEVVSVTVEEDASEDEAAVQSKAATRSRSRKGR